MNAKEAIRRLASWVRLRTRGVPRQITYQQRENPKRQVTLRGVSHDLRNLEQLGRIAAQDADDFDCIAAEGSLYLGGFLPKDVPNDKIRVILESPDLFAREDGGRHPTRLYRGGRAIPAEARGLRRMFETIAKELESDSDARHRRQIVRDLLHMRRRYPDVVVFNEPEAWLRTVWYESDLLFQFALCRDSYRLFGAFVYSDMDEAFAEFVREHANAISAMTGEHCLLFAFDGDERHDSDLRLGAEYIAYRVVLKTPERFGGSGNKSPAELDALRQVESRMLSDVSGINRSLLFGRKLGVRTEETPCLVFWETMEDKRAAVFSFGGIGADDSGKLAGVIKELADIIADVVTDHEMNPLEELKARTASLAARRETQTTGGVGQEIRAFLAENTPPVRDRLFVEDIDSFAQVRAFTAHDIEHLLKGGGYLDLSEDLIQTGLERILSVSFHKEDWGGELNDLYSANVRVNGVRLPTAFLLKGNGLKRSEMRIADCGKNGDQLLRLFKSPANLFVIQFVGNVSEAVIADVQSKVAERRSSGKPAWYLIMDGQDTARLLYAYKQLEDFEEHL